VVNTLRISGKGDYSDKKKQRKSKIYEFLPVGEGEGGLRGVRIGLRRNSFNFKFL